MPQQSSADQYSQAGAVPAVSLPDDLSLECLEDFKSLLVAPEFPLIPVFSLLAIFSLLFLLLFFYLSLLSPRPPATLGLGKLARPPHLPAHL